MSTSPRLGFTELAEGETVPETAVNEMLRYAEQGANKFIVKDKDIDDPPGSPADGDAYIVATASPTGAWTGWGNRIAFYENTAWRSIVPIEGTFAYVQDENKLYLYGGASWAEFVGASGQTAAVADDLWEGTSLTKYATPSALALAAVPTALTSSANITPDGDDGFNFTLTLAHNATLENPANFDPGDSGVIEITQDGTGSRTMAFGSNWKFPGGAPVLSTAAGAIDVLAYFVVASGRILANLSKAYSS